MALFGEKYGDTVRVIKFGDSIELCGGTHTLATGNIGYFKIISESAIAAGVRRIEATTGVGAEAIVKEEEDLLKQLKSLFNNTPNLVASIQKLIDENDQYKKAFEEVQKEKAISLKKKILLEGNSVNGYKLFVLKGEYAPEIVKNVAFMLRSECTESIFIAGTDYEGKPNLTLMYTDDLVAHGMNASKDIREAAKFINGGGGGQPFFASAGGKNTAGLNDAVNKLIELSTK